MTMAIAIGVVILALYFFAKSSSSNVPKTLEDKAGCLAVLTMQGDEAGPKLIKIGASNVLKCEDDDLLMELILLRIFLVDYTAYKVYGDSSKKSNFMAHFEAILELVISEMDGDDLEIYDKLPSRQAIYGQLFEDIEEGDKLSAEITIAFLKFLGVDTRNSQRLQLLKANPEFPEIYFNLKMFIAAEVLSFSATARMILKK